MDLNEDELDLAADLNKALDEQMGAKPAAEEAAETIEQEVKEYVREGRRFVPKSAKEEAAEAPAQAQEQPQAAAPKEWRPLWYKDEYGEWGKYPEPLRKALEQREREFAKGIEQHATTAKAWEPVNQLIAPHMAELQAQGVSPQQYVTNLVNADKYLRQDPVAALNWLAQSYLGTDLYGVADWMQQQAYQTQKPDPVKQELEALKQQLAQLQQAPIQAERQRLQQELQSWSQDKPYFEDVRAYMAALARTPDYQGATYDQLYEGALRAHPQLWQRIQEDQRKQEVQRARATAATSPRGTPQGEARPTKKAGWSVKSIEDELAQRFDEAGIT